MEKFQYDDKKNIIGYASVTEDYFCYLYTGMFEGCASLKSFPTNPMGIIIDGSCMANSGFEVFVINPAASFYGSGVFANMPKLKEVWINPSQWGMSISKEAFANLAGDVNIYFYTMTSEEAIEMCGEEWLKNASEKAHFYFKDTIPAGAVLPEGVVIPK